jgi:hypothetical protein
LKPEILSVIGEYIFSKLIKLGDDPEVKFQEIKSHIFQEIKRKIRRSKVSFFRRSKALIIFVNCLIIRSKVFDSVQEIKS